ncbi:hypothetical protein BCF55_0829 [Hydrogenivirga caldilitoris]|uniref:Uncharacterized protein n=1 Tax=Hydrogenivirga caldilitoris TaxID=246264 RepID=A0A497XUH5_9AQUI|nr:hypothetical protein [Hydrogenivirga caldilitoris]RLJ70553.1 hypothetical protein BCF55_0829 [Hydrogenivirga caldilitoris]
MEQVEEFTFNIKKFLSNISSAQEEELNELRRWLGRNEKRFMCILEHHFAFDNYAHLIEDCEKDRCMVNWLKVYKYINILGIQLNMTVYPVILWDIPLGGAHQISYNAQFRYKKGWISKRETIEVNGKELEEYVLKKLPRDGFYIAHKLQNEVIKLADYIISVVFSRIMKCEGINEIMV